MEMVYIVTNGDMMKAKDVYKMLAHEFIFTAEYLIKKRNIEIREENERTRKQNKIT